MILDRGIINYSFLATYYNWMLENEEQLRNLDNNGYWQRQMTDDEREMRKHPNRSHQWVPNRLKEIREDLSARQLDKLLGPEGWKKNSWSSVENCYRCGISMDRLIQYQRDLRNDMDIRQTKWLKTNPNGFTQITQDAFDKILKDSIITINPNYSQQEIDKSVIYHPELHSYCVMGDLRGFCPDCYQNKIKPLLGWDSRLDNYK